LLGGLDVRHESVVRVSGGLLVRAAGGMGCREKDLQHGALAGSRGGFDLLL
jgi:hypothetical protein